MVPMNQTIEIEPQPRIDTLVRLAAGGDARRTEYVGTVWLDGKPEVSGLVLRRPPNAPRGIRTPNFATSFFVPDSLPYTRSRLGDATLSISLLLQASGETGAVVDARAVFTDDPAGHPVTWIQVHLQGHIGWPAGLGYRIVALTPPDAAP
ncbi:hypothetical protein MAGR_08500 [Mycolicibacterium agri]|uniref:Uncharacterized protein n=2 Tax=Mycolicibacterium agri TaxID=36811 RepID=A0A7I9VW61_MYCAG|nr:hypothetical protein MAGR_08500 [Mycolicibacterium agri]